MSVIYRLFHYHTAHFLNFGYRSFHYSTDHLITTHNVIPSVRSCRRKRDPLDLIGAMAVKSKHYATNSCQKEHFRLIKTNTGFPRYSRYGRYVLSFLTANLEFADNKSIFENFHFLTIFPNVKSKICS
jgi:hypothetical protein